ncbi:ABC transporter substrate-binding protein [Streptomyces violaceusniger]|uniref:Extracellular solute-binding protein n=3 Tax=Streptomyces TaxID=1883 RepID=A0ABD5JLG6_9ACTN|nr:MULTISPECIES: extracellular solute-binding protein [Streptomyces]KUL62307.1 ABC transporter substrate-binding protein [Streptomyces violaceusniger]MEE4589096.1 extracellular solute-binding protein [Streptomyces sp. DSM 41602]WTB10955.1 extracellular solute-binding protein [Streptomyces antimycoticus]
MSNTVTRTRLAALAAATGIAVLLAGCSSSPDASDKASAPSCAPAKAKVTLQYWNTVPGMDKVVALWNKKNPDIQVETKNISNDQYGILGNALKAGKAPDLAQVGYDELPNLRSQSAFVDASACKAATAAKSKFVPWSWSQTSFGGTGVFALPQDTGPMALFVRSDIFKKHGITIPKTWDEYADAAQKLHKADPKLDITFFDPNNAEWFNGLLWQNSAEMYSYSGDKWHVTVESDQSKQVADYWQKLISAKLVRTDLANGSTQMYAAYQKDQIASYVGAAWGYSMFRDNLPKQAGKWSIVPMPTWSANGSSGDWGGSTVAFMKGGKHLYESVKFNTWLNSDPEALAMENELGGLYPAANAGLQLPALSKGVPYYNNEKIFDVFADSSKKIDTSFAWGPTQKTVNLALQDAMAKAAAGDGTLGDALAKAQATALKSMKDQAIPATAGK